MGHDDPFAGKTVDADLAYYLDTSNTYTPTLTATTTDPNLGADGEINGAWHRNGHLITGWARFKFSGTGVDAGSGAYLVSLPFAADESIMDAPSNTGAFAFQWGPAYLRDASTTANNQVGTVHLRTSTSGLQIGVNVSGSVTNMSHSSPWTWADDDAAALFFQYLADPSGLPS